MRLSRTLTALAAMAATSSFLTACGTDNAASGAEGTDKEKDVLTFAAIPSEQDTTPDLDFKNVITVLEEETGMEVEVIKATDYNAVIEGMLAGDVDLGAFGPLSYVLAKNNGADISPIGTMTAEKDGEGSYQSYGIVPAGSDITSIEDFRDKTVCFVDPASTSGYLFPTTGLDEVGIDAKTDVNPVMAGGHDSSALAVKDGDCDAGFAYDDMIKELISAGSLKEGDLEVVWESEPIPESPVAMQNSLPEDLQEKIRTAFLERANVDALVESGICSDAESCEVTVDSENWGYVAIDDAAYDPVRKVCEVTQNEECAS